MLEQGAISEAPDEPEASSPALQEASRELQAAEHDAQVAFDCIALGEPDRAHTHALTARVAIDAAVTALAAALTQETQDTQDTQEDQALEVKQFLKEPAELPAGLDQVYLEDPVAAPAELVPPAHRLVAAGSDVGLYLLALDLLVRELAHPAPRDLAAERPPGVAGQLHHVRVQLLAGDVRTRLEEPPPGVEDDRQRVPQPRLDRIVPEHERPAEVGLPLLENRAEVAEGNVVVGDPAVRRVRPVRLQGVRAGPDDPLVPVLVHAEHLGRQVPDLVARLDLADARRDDPARLDGREQLRRLGLRVEQPGRANVLVQNGERHKLTLRRARRGRSWRGGRAGLGGGGRTG